jgi:hypothetical protein
MLAQVIEILAPGIPYTSDGTTWESVVFEDASFIKPPDVMYEHELYKLTNVEAINKSDKYVTPDYPHRLELDIQNWKDYRHALRHLPTTARPTLDEDGKLTGVEWPAIPTA